MGKLYISEYESTAVFNGQSVLAVQEPCLASQIVELKDGESVVSAPFSKQTHFIKFWTDEACALRFGDEPVATLNDAILDGGEKDYCGVRPGQRVAAIQHSMNTIQGNGPEQMISLLALLSDPAGSQQRLEELNKASVEAVKNQAAAELTIAEAKKLKAEVDAYKANTERGLASRLSSLETREVAFKAMMSEWQKHASDAEAALDRAATSTAAATAKLAEERATFDADSRQQLEQLGARESSVTAREQEATKRETALDAGESDYEARLAKIASLTPRKR